MLTGTTSESTPECSPLLQLHLCPDALTIPRCAGLLFSAAEVPRGWIRVGGILFYLIGLQYLGTGLGDKGQGTGDSFYRATVWSRLLLAAGETADEALTGATRSCGAGN